MLLNKEFRFRHKKNTKSNKIDLKIKLLNLSNCKQVHTVDMIYDVIYIQLDFNKVFKLNEFKKSCSVFKLVNTYIHLEREII